MQPSGHASSTVQQALLALICRCIMDDLLTTDSTVNVLQLLSDFSNVSFVQLFSYQLVSMPMQWASKIFKCRMHNLNYLWTVSVFNNVELQKKFGKVCTLFAWLPWVNSGKICQNAHTYKLTTAKYYPVSVCCLLVTLMTRVDTKQLARTGLHRISGALVVFPGQLPVHVKHKLLSSATRLLLCLLLHQFSASTNVLPLLL